MVSHGTGIQPKSVSCPHTIHPAWCSGGCLFTLALLKQLLWLIALSTQPEVLIFSWNSCVFPGSVLNMRLYLCLCKQDGRTNYPISPLLLGHEIERFIAPASTHLNCLVHKIIYILTLLLSLFYNCKSTQQNNSIQHIWSPGYSNFGYRCTRKLFCFQLGFSQLQIDSVAH